jgi:AcrR family transcriptional regulator
VAQPGTPSRRLDRRKQKTRDLVVAAAMPLFRQHGFDAVTMEQIAERADIAKGTLYSHFPAKEAIVAAFLERESLARNADRIVRMRALRTTRSRLTASLAELVDAVRAQPGMFERFFTYRVQQMVSLKRGQGGSGGLRILEDAIIRMGQEQGELRTDLPFEIIEALFEFAFIIVAQHYYDSPATFDARRTIGHCVDVFMNGAGVKGRQR